MKEIVLASSSKYRRAQLERLGLKFTSIPPEVDEEELKRANSHLTPEQMAALLAEEKVRSVQSRKPDAVIIGGDQIVEIDGQLLSKPQCQKGAVYQLTRLKGKTHRLYSSVAVYHPQGERLLSGVEVATLTMRDLTAEEIKKYLELDRPFDCVGCYKIESFGILLFSEIQSRDFTAITGLPLLKLSAILEKLGISPFTIFGNFS